MTSPAPLGDTALVEARASLHAVTWLVWAVAAAVTVQLAPNPAYVAVIVGIAALVVEVHGRDSAIARAFPAFVALGASFAIIRVVLTALTTHGVGSAVFTLPEAALPRLLGGFTVGGSVELPVVLQSAAEGFAIVGLVAVFGAFNAVVSHYELVQSSPRSFYEMGLAVTVALAFTPSTIAAVTATGLADRARTGGVAVRRGRVLRRALPVLESGMERAVALSESMDSRGFARLEPSRFEHVAAWCSLGALLAFGGAFVALVGRAGRAGTAFGVAGVVLLAIAITAASRATSRTRYRARRPRRLDWFVMGVSCAAPLTVAILAAVGDESLRWSATPLRWPTVNAGVVVATALLALPAALRPARAVTARPVVVARRPLQEPAR